MEFNRDTIAKDLTGLQCKCCGETGATMTFAMLDTPHFGRLTCKACGRFIEWMGLPDQAKTDRRASRKKLRDLGDRCELCLRHKNELPHPQSLTVHHVLEVAADDGPDDLENLRVYCTACHSHVNWLRTYFGHYHPDV